MEQLARYAGWQQSRILATIKDRRSSGRQKKISVDDFGDLIVAVGFELFGSRAMEEDLR